MVYALMDALSGGRILLADGAMGTMLQQAGKHADECGEAWNVQHPEKVRAIHEAYLNAGSGIVLTNTFGGTRFRLREYGNESRVEELNRAAVKNAREAALSHRAFVFGDIGPSGELMEPYGEVPEEAMFAIFREQANALVGAGADAIIVETMTSAAEMAVALRAVREISPDIPLVASYSIQKTAGQFRTMMGETVAQCVDEAIAAGANVVGCNCGLGIEEMIELVKEMRASTDAPIIAQPNAGLPEIVDGRIVYRQTPQMMAEQVPALVTAGASIIGGCCGTNPDYIARIRQQIG